MIQDIAPLHLSNEFCEKTPQPGSRVLLYGEKTVYLKYDGAVAFPTYGQMTAGGEDAVKEAETGENAAACGAPKYIYLFSIGGEDYFLANFGMDSRSVEACGEIAKPIAQSAEAEAAGRRAESDGFRFYRLFDVRAMQPKDAVFAVATGWHLRVWYRDNRFCGRCGEKLVHAARRRMLECPHCGNQVFPKIAPAVIVGLVNGDKIMMTRYAGREYRRHALIAGFAEIGETAEETVAREVKEEVGLSVKNIRYYKSQPWGFDGNLLLGYFCELAAEADIALDTEELASAEWVDYHDISDDTEKLTLTREMMTYFKKKKMKES